MTEIEKKALALVQIIDPDCRNLDECLEHELREALCRAIEQHEAFRQEVSDAITEYCGGPKYVPSEPLARFIIAKPDPLADVLSIASSQVPRDVFAERLAARGLKIVEDK